MSYQVQDLKFKVSESFKLNPLWIKSFNRLFLLIFITIPLLTKAQSDRKQYRTGNKLFKDGKYSDAEIAYRKGLEKTKDPFVGEFGLGDALYKQGKYEEATTAFKQLLNKQADKSIRAKTFHNMGNALLKSKKYEESIEAYKQSLKQMPSDADTKYNLAYAKAMLKEQQQQQQQQNKDNKQNKDKNKDQQQKQDKQDKDKKQDKQDQQQQSKPQQQKLSKEEAERLLEAMNNKEKDLQKKLQKKEAAKAGVEKDW